MSWKTHIQRKLVNPSVATEVSDEMRTAVATWVYECYGIHPRDINPNEIGENYWRAKVALALGYQSSPSVAIELCIHETGRIEQTLVVHPGCQMPDKRISLPDGALPPDNEEFATLVAQEICDTWRKRPVGWHPAHRSIYDCLCEIAERDGISFDQIFVGGLYPDGETCPDFGASYLPTLEGLRDALTHLRAMLKGGMRWQQAYKGKQDEGSFCMMLSPGDSPADGGMLTLDPESNYESLVDDTDSGRRWDNILPMTGI